MFTAALFTEPKSGNNQNMQILENELWFTQYHLTIKKKQATDTHNTGESQKHYANEEKPLARNYHVYDILEQKSSNRDKISDCMV